MRGETLAAARRGKPAPGQRSGSQASRVEHPSIPGTCGTPMGTGGGASQSTRMPHHGSRRDLCSHKRRLCSRAEAMRQDAMRQLGFIGGLAGPPLPGLAGSPLHDALNAVAARVHAAITRPGLSRADLWPLLGRFAWPATSRPPAPADPFGPARAPACPRPGRDTHRNHHGAIPGAHRVTMNTTASP